MTPLGLGEGPLGSMPLGGSYDTSIEVNRSDPTVYRRAWVKRRSAVTGQFEANWQNVTQYVEKWGSLTHAIDDARPFKVRHNGATLVVRNDEGKFNHHSNLSSMWYGYMVRDRSLVKIEAGYIDDAGNEVPYEPIQGIFVMDDELANSAEKDSVALKCSSLQSIFDSIKAAELPGMDVTMTASELFTKIKNHTDGSGVAIFQQFISAGAWTIPTTTNYYWFNTDSALQQDSTWTVMEKVAEAENMVVLVNRTGGIELTTRAARTTTSVFAFQGQGFRKQNVIKLTEQKDAIHKTFATFRLKWVDSMSDSAYVSAGTTTVVSPTNVPWQTGNNIYSFENYYVANTATAQLIVNALQADFSVLKKEYEIDATFVPELELLDPVTLGYHSYDLSNSPLWDTVYWDDFNWASDGENFNLDAVPLTVISKRLDLDNFIHTIRLREA